MWPLVLPFENYSSSADAFIITLRDKAFEFMKALVYSCVLDDSLLSQVYLMRILLA